MSYAKKNSLLYSVANTKGRPCGPPFSILFHHASYIVDGVAMHDLQSALCVTTIRIAESPTKM
jgi:hypothetical protein